MGSHVSAEHWTSHSYFLLQLDFCAILPFHHTSYRKASFAKIQWHPWNVAQSNAETVDHQCWTEDTVFHDILRLKSTVSSRDTSASSLWCPGLPQHGLRSMTDNNSLQAILSVKISGVIYLLTRSWPIQDPTAWTAWTFCVLILPLPELPSAWGPPDPHPTS